MALRCDTSDPQQVRLTFSLPIDQPPGPVSVVGSFNDWTPGIHELTLTEDGIRTVAVTVPYGRAVHFRYLAADGIWFDEPDADEVTAIGSLLNPIEAPERPTAESQEPSQTADPSTPPRKRAARPKKATSS